MDLMDIVPEDKQITEHIIVGLFDSRSYDMWLMDRSAPTPNKNSITESVAFMNGVHDFSRMLGEDSYQNRPLGYTFHIYQRNKVNRKHLQTVIENQLMKQGITDIQDSYDYNYRYVGKCTNVDIQDDHVNGRLIVTITFDCYPFKIAKLPEGNDIWDTFNFDLDVAQPIEYKISGTQSIELYNQGVPSVAPEITVSGSITLTKGNYQTTITDNTFKSDVFRLMPGVNAIQANGQGTINFKFFKELI